MATLTVSLEEFGIEIEKLPKRMERTIIKGLRFGARRLQVFTAVEISNAQPRPAVDTGGLKRSTRVDRKPTGAEVTVDAPHAAAIEHGTRPHWPPLAPLVRWVIRKGLVKGGPSRAAQRRAEFIGPLTSRQAAARERAQERVSEHVEEAEEVARAIQMKIAREGTAPRRYFMKAFERMLPEMINKIEQDLEDTRLGGED